jgi:PAS domain-containing protein
MKRRTARSDGGNESEYDVSASLGNVVTVAQRLLDRLGKGAPEMLDRRATFHVARYWQRVAKAARFILLSDEGYYCAGQGSRPITLPSAVVRRVFISLPQPTVLLQPNLVIVGANQAYLDTMRVDDDIVGCELFAVFPDNPAETTVTSTQDLAASFGRVIDTGRPDHLSLRYDVRNRDGVFEARWWHPVNTPVLDDRGRLELIIHQAFETVAG